MSSTPERSEHSVYTIVYSENSKFLLFQKNDEGYFFSDKATPSTRVIVNAGQQLKHHSKFTFPGGGFDPEKDWASDADVKAEALREFWEECGTVLEDGDIIGRDLKRCGNNKYAGYFLRVRPRALESVREVIAVALKQGEKARAAVRSNSSTTSTPEYFNHYYPKAPMCNELERVFALHTVTNKERIKQLGRDADTDRHHTLIGHIAPLLKYQNAIPNAIPTPGPTATPDPNPAVMYLEVPTVASAAAKAGGAGGGEGKGVGGNVATPRLSKGMRKQMALKRKREEGKEGEGV
ncbi:hypothetical protein B484DRAFT_443613 [Ochromonadaceae sp. CCMP2298]|nr:hypothetical protein B484DRAFT_443613 [Ochromonadaceae sp. CCMP2298]